jgi:opacity protein-like surface antigen
MKKLLFLLCLLPIMAGTGFAQGARQDINLSASLTIQPYVEGSDLVQMRSTLGPGLYLGYRYLLTPNGAVEANYSYTRFTNKFLNLHSSSVSAVNNRIYTSMQESTFAYVRTIPFRRYNPFIEGGGGLLYFSPEGSIKTTTYDTQQVNSLTVLFGGGVAYELSPSWDLRVQYRGQVFKTQDYGIKALSTGRMYIMSQPSIGFAYHF